MKKPAELLIFLGAEHTKFDTWDFKPMLTFTINMFSNLKLNGSGTKPTTTKKNFKAK